MRTDPAPTATVYWDVAETSNNLLTTATAAAALNYSGPRGEGQSRGEECRRQLCVVLVLTCWHPLGLALYPLSAFRAMSAAALNVYRTIRADGTQKKLLPTMQTRAELYECLNYQAYEQKMDELFKKKK